MNEKITWTLTMLLAASTTIVSASEAIEKTVASKPETSSTLAAKSQSATKQLLTDSNDGNVTGSEQAKNFDLLSPGQSVHGRLSSSSSVTGDGSYANFYRMRGTPGQQYEITLRSDDFDSYLIVIDDNDRSVAQNDDYGGTLNARVRFAMPASGSVQVLANSVFADETGSYELAAIEVQPPRSSGDVQAGQRVNGLLDDNSDRLEYDDTLIDWWTLAVQGGREYEVRMESDDFDAYLLIANTQGDVLGSDDDSGGGYNAAVRLLPATDGTVRIGANQALRQAGGYYQLVVTEIEPLAIPTGGPRDGRYALVVGIADYPGVDSDLPLVENDVVAVLSMLKNDFGYSDSEIFVLRNEQATRNNVVRAVREFLGQAGPEGHALLYYSGHGTQTEGNLALVEPLDPEPDGKDEAIVLYDGLLLDDEVGFLLRTLDAGSMTVLFDSCFSGTAARGDGMKFVELKEATPFAPTPKNFLTDDWNVPNELLTSDEGFFGPLELDRRVTFVAASAEDEVAWVANDLNMSLFTYMIVNRAPAHRNLDIDEFIRRFAPPMSDYVMERFSLPQTINGEWIGAPKKVSELFGASR